VSVPRAGRAATIALAAVASVAAPARAAVPHYVQPGETLWSIAAANNFTTRTVAAYNGLSETAQVYVGETIEIPTEAEGAAALSSAGSATGTLASSTAPTVSHTVTPGESLSSVAAANGLSPSGLAADNGMAADSMLLIGQTIEIPAASSGPGLGDIPSPSGTLHLAEPAAQAWNAMRQESLRVYGIDLYPDGSLSAYRTYDQQKYLYDLYLSGQGTLAAPPGTSAHNFGNAVDLADPSMRNVIDQIGAGYGWAKTEAPDEWWHVNYVGG
jgi:LysM repeat protein